MLEDVGSVFLEHWVAVVIFAIQMAIRPVVRYFDLRPDDDELSAWVLRYRELGRFPKGIVDGVLLTISSLAFEWYILTIAVPRLRGGVVSAIVGLFMLLVGAGVGLSIGKALTETDYSWYEK